MTDAPTIRTVLFENDADTKAQTIVDIVERDVPGTSDNSSWTTLTRECNAAKRAMLLDLSRQIDLLIAGEIDEITIVKLD
jgi:hypothetical protein